MKERSGVLSVKRETVLTFLVLLVAAITAPIFIKQQLITGTIVNAAIIIGTVLSTRDGLLIGLLPSSLALATGLLSPVLAPVVPFIILGNAILVLTFAYFRKFNFWAGVAFGSFFKFTFLYATSTVFIGLLAPKLVAPVVTQMMTWPQLITALAGGLVAFGYFKLTGKLSTIR